MRKMVVDITILPTPNPNALKFVISKTVKNKGKSTYTSKESCESIPMAKAIFDLPGVETLHLFQNVVTLSKNIEHDWGSLEEEVFNTIQDHIENHDANYFEEDPEEVRRSGLPNDLRTIEEILDRTIRPGLQGDGGDLTCLSYDDDVLIIRYEGACGSCPSSTGGTLEAIKAILRDEFSEDLQVYLENPTPMTSHF